MGMSSSSPRRAAGSGALVIAAATLVAAATAVAPALEVWVEPVTGMPFVRLPAGSFVMGTPADEPGREPGETPHRVTLTRAFFLGQHEVTQAEWQLVMGDNPSHFQDCGPDCPVERVSYFDVRAFIDRLDARSGGSHFRLPTEAEWEYACRAGTITPYYTGRILTTDQANFNGRFPMPGAPLGIDRGHPTPVGTFPPNAWGLFDMHGNVWEWTEDRHCPYPDGPVADPVGTCAAEKRVIRGGSWHFDANSARCGLRYDHRPQDRGFSLGFRLVRESGPSSGATTRRETPRAARPAGSPSMP
jgi:formylglycine-generating enzyme required for sulfatase activity